MHVLFVLAYHLAKDIASLANVNSNYMLSSARLSVVCNVRAPYSGD